MYNVCLWLSIADALLAAGRWLQHYRAKGRKRCDRPHQQRCSASNVCRQWTVYAGVSTKVKWTISLIFFVHSLYKFYLDLSLIPPFPSFFSNFRVITTSGTTSAVATHHKKHDVLSMCCDKKCSCTNTTTTNTTITPIFSESSPKKTHSEANHVPPSSNCCLFFLFVIVPLFGWGNANQRCFVHIYQLPKHRVFCLCLF